MSCAARPRRRGSVGRLTAASCGVTATVRVYLDWRIERALLALVRTAGEGIEKCLLRCNFYSSIQIRYSHANCTSRRAGPNTHMGCFMGGNLP